MTQSRRMSLIEAIINTVVGLALAVGIQLAAFPVFGIKVGIADNLIIGVIFTVVSIGRSYVLRRLFERWRFPVPVVAYRTSKCD